MALTKLTTDLIDGSLGTDWQTAVKTAAFTATAGEGYFVNTTSAAITVTLPSSPTTGDEVSIVDYGLNAATNNITITSSDNIEGAADDLTLFTDKVSKTFVYSDATKGWLIANDSSDTSVPPLTVDYLVVAGGGGAGFDVGGGGGAGGLRTSYGSTSGGGASAETSLSLIAATNYTVTVGAGGGSSGSSGVKGANGSNSIFSTVNSIGGGGAGTYPSSGAGKNGGSGGGGAVVSGGPAGGSGTANQGYDGGSASSTNYGSGGGGGAGGAGANGVQGAQVDGGLPLAVSITGSSVNYAGGGYGNADSGSVYATGRNKSNTQLGTYGFGANGTGLPNANPNGGNAGVVILRYSNTYTITIGSGLTGSTATDGSDKVTTFTAGTGTITLGAA